jgi:hypothetical protein
MSSFTTGDRSEWQWTMMVMQPDFIDGDFIEESGCEPSGEHHEIYLSDIRKADSVKWKMVIRQPMG